MSKEFGSFFLWPQTSEFRYTVCPQCWVISWPQLLLLRGRHIWKPPNSMLTHQDDCVKYSQTAPPTRRTTTSTTPYPVAVSPDANPGTARGDWLPSEGDFECGYRELQLYFTPELGGFYMLFLRCHNKIRKTSLRLHVKYFNFRRKIQLDHPTGSTWATSSAASRRFAGSFPSSLSWGTLIRYGIDRGWLGSTEPVYKVHGYKVNFVVVQLQYCMH